MQHSWLEGRLPAAAVAGAWQALLYRSAASLRRTKVGDGSSRGPIAPAAAAHPHTVRK